MASWRLARSIEKLREQINLLFPNRDKSSDGTIGDLSHQERKSDHNPNSQGVVTAIDIDKDLTDVVKVDVLVKALQESEDPRIKYIIYNGKITQKTNIQKWKPYTGINAHKHHMHLSVASSSKLYDDAKDWNLSLCVPLPTKNDINPPGQTYTVMAGDNLTKIGKKFGVTVKHLMEVNNLKNDVIKIGQILKI